MFNRKFMLLCTALLAALLIVPAALAQDAAEEPASPLAGTQWTLVSLLGADVVENTEITLALNADGSANGSAGCNNYGSSMTSIEGSRISFGMAFSTMMACMEEGVMEQESAYLMALSTVTEFALEDGQLRLITPDGDLVFDPLPGLAGTSWQLTQFGEDAAVGEVTITFDDEGSAFGSAGCNRFNAGYTASVGSVNFGPALSTRMMCPDEAVVAQETAFLMALETVLSYELDGDTLTLITNDGNTLTFSRVLTLAETEWQLVSLNGTDALPDVPVTLSFNAENEISGMTGCNVYGTSYSVDGSSITFNTAVRTTMRACIEDGSAEQEQAFLAALVTVTSFELTSEQLTLTTADGGTLVFVPLAAE